MVGATLTLLMFAILIAIVRKTSVPARDDLMMRLMVGGFLLRIVVHAISRDFSFFSHGGGGDYVVYELQAMEINRIWSFSGFEWVTEQELEGIGPTSLPPNLFAFIFALNGGEPTTFGATSVVVLSACLTCLNLYHLAVELGSDPRQSRLLVTAIFFSPAFVLYSSDMYKDPIVLFFATGAVASAVRLSKKLSFQHLVFGAVCLWALWFVRFYLVFVASAPLFVGLAGLRARSSTRPLFAMLLFGAAFAIMLGSTDVLDQVTEKADQTFQHGTSENVRQANASSGSGVTFDDGGNPWAALGPKLAYMIFSPFPWAGGSVGFQIGKLDTFLWYFILYRAFVAAKRLWKQDRATLFMFLAFLVPTTVMYATSFSNVGLSLRQRLIIVVIASVLASMSWPRRSSARAQVKARPPQSVRLNDASPARVST